MDRPNVGTTIFCLRSTLSWTKLLVISSARNSSMYQITAKILYFINNPLITEKVFQFWLIYKTEPLRKPILPGPGYRVTRVNDHRWLGPRPKPRTTSRPHAQGGELRLLIMVASTPTLGRESVKIYYRNDPVKYDLAFRRPARLYLYTRLHQITCIREFLVAIWRLAWGKTLSRSIDRRAAELSDAENIETREWG